MPISSRAAKLIEKIMTMVEWFNLAEIQDLYLVVETRMHELEDLAKFGPATDTVAIAIDDPEGTIKEQYRRCGKQSCHCRTEGKLHGPYRYLYYRQAGQLKSKYLGKA